MANHIAVYGTLRYGGGANHLMKGCKHIGTDRIRGRMFSLVCFPVITLDVDEDADEWITVDVYELPEEEKERNLTLRNIDRYEGYFPGRPDQSMYDRVTTLTEKGNLEVFTYVGTSKSFTNYKQIESGDWFSHEDSYK